MNSIIENPLTASLYALYLSHPAVTTDSRVCPENSLFFALKGDRFDGNRYAADALKNGCAVAVVDAPEVIPVADASPEGTSVPVLREYGLHGRYFLVADVLAALQELAAYHRRQFRTWSRPVSVIGITGTNGKTTTKELLNAVLGRRYRVLATAGNLNNQIGVPLTLLRVTPDHEVAIIEMGANHPMDIAELCEWVRPDYGLITNVGKGHLLGFGSFEGVIEAKTKLYDSLRMTGGTAFVDAGNKHLWPRAAGLQIIPYGVAEEGVSSSLSDAEPVSACPVFGRLVDCSAYLKLALQIEGRSIEIDTRLIGNYNLYNVTAAAAVGHAFGIPVADIKQAIEEYVPSNMRSQLLKIGYDQEIILDAYNANPVSMQAALRSFSLHSAPQKSLILGDMGELGGESLAEHIHVLEYIMTTDFGDLLLVGSEFSAAFSSLSLEQLGRLGAKRNVRCYDTVDELCADTVVLQYLSGAVLIKGSRSNALEKVVETMKHIVE